MADPVPELLSSRIPPAFDPSVASPARMYDYLLGGTHHFAADREAVEMMSAVSPDMKDATWANRSFHQRVAWWLAGSGIRQFVDIGSGLPTVGNTHEIVQQLVPDAHILYVDNDPMVEVYADELLDRDGTTAVLVADMCEPATILESAQLASVIDLNQPVALMMTAVLQFVPDAADPWSLVRQYVDVLAPGSYLVLSHGTFAGLPASLVQTGEGMFAKSTQGLHLRSLEDIARFFDGLEIVRPSATAAAGVVHPGAWDADDLGFSFGAGSKWWLAAVARLP